jgi:protocadherin-15
MIVIPRYEPVFVEPSVKEYETQVLQMSVPLGDEDTLRKSTHHDRELWHPFHLDNISYITKDKTSNF